MSTSTTSSVVTVYNSPIPHGDYLAVIDAFSVKTTTAVASNQQTCNIVIVDVSGSMGQFVGRICNKILPDVFTKTNFAPNDTIDLITFGSETKTHSHKTSEFGSLPYSSYGGTRMAPVYPALETILASLAPTTHCRILTISDGEIQDSDQACKAANELYTTVKSSMNLSISSTAIRLFTSRDGSPSTAALASILQLNSTPTAPTLIDIAYEIGEKGELEFCQDAAVLIAHHFGKPVSHAYLAAPGHSPTSIVPNSDADRKSPLALFKKDPWSDQSCTLPLAEGRTLFWLSKTQFDNLKPTTLLISGLDSVPVVMSSVSLNAEIYEDLIAPRVEFFLMTIKLLRVVDSPESIKKLKAMAQYFIDLEQHLYPADDIATASALSTITAAPPTTAAATQSNTNAIPLKGFSFGASPDGSSSSSSSSSSSGFGSAAQPQQPQQQQQQQQVNFKSRLAQLQKKTKSENSRLGPKMQEIATMDDSTPYDSHAAAGFLRSTRCNNYAAGAVYAANQGQQALNQMSGTARSAYDGSMQQQSTGFGDGSAAPKKQSRLFGFFRSSSAQTSSSSGVFGGALGAAQPQQQQQQQLPVRGFGAALAAPQAAPAPSPAQANGSLFGSAPMQQQPQLQQRQQQQQSFFGSASRSAMVQLSATVDPDLAARMDVAKMVKNLDKLEKLLTPEIESTLKKSFVSDATTLDGIRAVCALATTTLQGQVIHAIDIGQRESVLDTMSAVDILSYLNIVGVPIQAQQLSSPQGTYTITKAFVNDCCSVSDLIVMKQDPTAPALYVPTDQTDSGRVDSVVPLLSENAAIATFLIENAPTLLAMTMAYAMTGKIENYELAAQAQLAALVACLDKAVAAAASPTAKASAAELLQSVHKNMTFFSKA